MCAGVLRNVEMAEKALGGIDLLKFRIRGFEYRIASGMDAFVGALRPDSYGKLKGSDEEKAEAIMRVVAGACVSKPEKGWLGLMR